MSVSELCPAHWYDDEDGERVVCLSSADQETESQNSCTFICWRCWDHMMDGRAARQEHKSK